VTANRQIAMELHTERSALQPLAAADLGFIFQTQRADNQLLVNDGETAVIGGLTVTSVTNTRTGIPLLSGLPIIGKLFSFSKQEENRRDLIILVTPRRSPLRDLAGHENVLGVVDLESKKDDVLELMEGIVPAKDAPPSALMIDDIELIGVDGWLVDAITKHLGKLRDSGSVIVASGTTDDLGSSYRGPVAALKKSRSGVLLSPGSASDGDHFGIKLPRSLASGMPPGRGIYVAAGQWQLVQVAEVKDT
jgi:hypothetical protein